VKLVLDEQREIRATVEAQVDATQPQVILVVHAVLGDACQLRGWPTHLAHVGTVSHVRARDPKKQLDECATEPAVGLSHRGQRLR
jgi:hypothetical protein